MRNFIVGHYCRICGRMRANEKFSGKGHKNHVCKDCSGKSNKKAKKNTLSENVFALTNLVAPDDTVIHLEEEFLEDDWFTTIDFEEQNEDDANDELPF